MRDFQEKTQPPSAKKIKDAKAKGVHARSSELAKALSFALCMLFFFFAAEMLIYAVKECFYISFSNWEIGAFPFELTLIFLLTFATIFLAHLLGYWLQGWVWNRPKDKRKESLLYRVILTSFKWVLFITIFYHVIKKLFSQGFISHGSFFSEVKYLCMHFALAYLLIGIFDFGYQKYRFYQDLKMTRQEVKEEKKEIDGDIGRKKERRRRLQELL